MSKKFFKMQPEWICKYVINNNFCAERKHAQTRVINAYSFNHNLILKIGSNLVVPILGWHVTKINNLSKKGFSIFFNMKNRGKAQNIKCCIHKLSESTAHEKGNSYRSDIKALPTQDQIFFILNSKS